MLRLTQRARSGPKRPKRDFPFLGSRDPIIRRSSLALSGSFLVGAVPSRRRTPRHVCSTTRSLTGDVCPSSSCFHAIALSVTLRVAGRRCWSARAAKYCATAWGAAGSAHRPCPAHHAAKASAWCTCRGFRQRVLRSLSPAPPASVPRARVASPPWQSDRRGRVRVHHNAPEWAGCGKSLWISRF